MSIESFTKQITVKPNDKQLLELLGVSTMTIEEIRANAPKTAKYYDDCGCYFRKKKGWLQIFDLATKSWSGVSNPEAIKLKPL